MKTIIINVPNNNALKLLKDLELNNIISIEKESEFNNYLYSGDPLSVQQFVAWIKNAEELPSVNLSAAKIKWEQKKTHLKSLIK